jgi:integral membrane sensor domain MASE1
MSIHENHSHGDDACAKPFSPIGLVIIGVLLFVSIVLWQYGPSVGTLVLLPLMLICPLTHFFMHRHRDGAEM